MNPTQMGRESSQAGQRSPRMATVPGLIVDQRLCHAVRGFMLKRDVHVKCELDV